MTNNERAVLIAATLEHKHEHDRKARLMALTKEELATMVSNVFMHITGEDEAESQLDKVYNEIVEVLT